VFFEVHLILHHLQSLKFYKVLKELKAFGDFDAFGVFDILHVLRDHHHPCRSTIKRMIKQQKEEKPKSPNCLGEAENQSK
jgi:hypothetical protein